MTDAVLKCIHQDLELLKNELAVIKHVLYEEGELSEEAKTRLEKARKTPISKYVRL